MDIPLTEKGVMEALAGGRAVCEIDFDIIFTSRLVRAKQTALIAMTQVWIHNLLYMPKAFVIVCDAFVGYDQCCLVYSAHMVSKNLPMDIKIIIPIKY